MKHVQILLALALLGAHVSLAIAQPDRLTAMQNAVVELSRVYGPCRTITNDRVIEVLHIDDVAPATSIQSALDGLRALYPGLHVVGVIPDGTYGLEHEIIIPDDCSLVGEGTVILWPAQRPGGKRFMIVPGSRSTLMNLRLEIGSGARNCNLFGIKGTDVSNVLIKGCQFVGADYDPDPNDDENPQVYDCIKFSDCLVSGIDFQDCRIENSDRANLSVDAAAIDITFLRCTFTDARAWAVNLEPQRIQNDPDDPSDDECQSIRDVIFKQCLFDSRNTFDPTADSFGPVSLSVDTQDVVFRQCHFIGDSGGDDKFRVVADAVNGCGFPDNIRIESSLGVDVVACVRLMASGGCIAPDGQILSVSSDSFGLD